MLSNAQNLMPSRNFKEIEQKKQTYKNLYIKEPRQVRAILMDMFKYICLYVSYIENLKLY